MTRTRWLPLLAVLVSAWSLCGCGGAARPAAGSKHGVQLPPVGVRFSYQIGGAYPPPAGVGIVDRDSTDAPAPGIYSICYVNAFQAQPDQRSWWSEHHPGLLLHDPAGRVVLDTQWDEPLFDIADPADREQLATVIGGWIDGCAARGFRAVEADNLDSYTRSSGALTAADALAFARLLIARAHRDHLAIAQKNAADLSREGRLAGFDFAIAEECQLYAECDTYRHSYGNNVIEIEYSDNPITAFTTACAQRGNQISIVLRDRDVTPPSDPHHVERWCP